MLETISLVSPDKQEFSFWTLRMDIKLKPHKISTIFLISNTTNTTFDNITFSNLVTKWVKKYVNEIWRLGCNIAIKKFSLKIFTKR